jgi:hypothetical protein
MLGYLANNLMIGSLTRTQTFTLESIPASMPATATVKSMISGLTLFNKDGPNNYVSVSTSISANSPFINHVVTVIEANYLKEICILTILIDISVN